MMPHAVTARQKSRPIGDDRRREILAAIREYTAERGHAPSIEEIADLVGVASTNTVRHHLRVLEMNGQVRRDPRRPRTLVVTGSTDGA